MKILSHLKLRRLLPALWVTAALWMSVSSNGQSALLPEQLSVVIDGSRQFQKMDGFGVNLNTSWWLDGEYRNSDAVKPAIDLLADELGATLFRAVIEEMDWEAMNDNEDPDSFNWDYYDAVFTSDRFQGVWNTLRYLNQKGITDGLIISFMGAPPASHPMAKAEARDSWMGDTGHGVHPRMEDEFVESIAALLYYARHRAQIRFTLVSPMNETDIIGMTRSEEHPRGIVEGPDMPDALQFTRVITKLARKLDAIGMDDIRFVAPDAGGDRLFGACVDAMVRDPYLMGKMAHWGVHDYGNDAANYREIVDRPNNPLTSFWVTETAGITNLFGQLDDQASSFIFWDGFDAVYQHAIRNGYGTSPPNDWVFWIGDQGKPLIEYRAGTLDWIPRKQFYEYAQLFKFIRPGAIRIAATASHENLSVYAFLNPDQEVVLVGRNPSVHPVTVKGELKNLETAKTLELFYTDSLHNLSTGGDLAVSAHSFEAIVPARSVFTLTGQAPRLKPEPPGWYAGDMHVHRDCGGPEEGILPEDQFIEMMEVNDLAVISVLADMGNGEVQPSETDLPKVKGKDYHSSLPGRIIRYDAEWHWDPAGVTFEHKALGGHIVLLGLTEAQQIWEESPYKILDYGKDREAVVGFCHMQYLSGTLPETLDCCTPIDYPVEAALGTIDFLAEDVWLNDEAVKAYYRLLNCGFRLGWAAGTDYPCNSAQPLGSLLTYVQVKDAPLTYERWVEGIKQGRTVVATNGHVEFLDLKVNGDASPGDEVKLDEEGMRDGEGMLDATVTWTATRALTGTVELVCNGKIVATLEGPAGPGEPLVLQARVPVSGSSWICARRMDPTGHQSHTAPVYISINDRPVRASAADAQYFVAWIDGILENIKPGGPWNQYFTQDLEAVQSRYREARAIYKKVALEAQNH